MELLLVQELITMVGGSLDSLQFAYRLQWGGRGSQPNPPGYNGKAHGLQKLVRILFMDFSSAFNINTLLHCFQGLYVYTHLVLWIKDFLTNRHQHLKVDGFKSTAFF